MSRRLLVMLLAIAPAGCTRPAAHPTVSPSGVSLMPVPPDCDPSRVRVDWSRIDTRPILTRVQISVQADMVPSTTETPPRRLLDAPFTPSVVGIAAPPAWLTALSRSLRAETGTVARVASPTPRGDTFS